jgi:hypothetical protein
MQNILRTVICNILPISVLQRFKAWGCAGKTGTPFESHHSA